jgi:hypothetical protein
MTEPNQLKPVSFQLLDGPGAFSLCLCRVGGGHAGCPDRRLHPANEQTANRVMFAPIIDFLILLARVLTSRLLKFAFWRPSSGF